MKMIVIVGESAAGKSTVQNEICKEPVFEKVITYTTRPPRENEKDGVDYHFISKEEFEKRIGENFFVEYTQYRGWYYGTAEKDCKPNTVAVLNPQGMRSLKARGFEFVSFYIKVDRRSRLIKILQRGDEIEETYRRNLTDVGQFIGVGNEVDYVVINDNYNLSPTFIAELILDKYCNHKERMYEVMMCIDDKSYCCYGRYKDRNKANEIALQLRKERNVDTEVRAVMV